MTEWLINSKLLLLASLFTKAGTLTARVILLAAGYVQVDFDEMQLRAPFPNEEAAIEELAADAVLARVVSRVRAVRGPFIPL